MCNNEKDGCCKKGCVGKMIAKILVIVGGLNWGLVGIGMMFNIDLNIVKMILGWSSALEGIVYILVGISAVMLMIHCKCKKCTTGCEEGVCEAKKEVTEIPKTE